MKVAFAGLLGILLAASSFAQGTVHFANTTTTQITTNSGFISQPGQLPNQFGNAQFGYEVGLYIAPQGTTDPAAFTLMGPTTTNIGAPFPGIFNGGSSFVISNNTGQTIAFQVRAWSTFAGSTFEYAAAYPFAYLGTSAIGFVTPGGFPPGAPPANLFGTNPGQVGGFLLLTPIPEPSANALIVLGLGIGLMFLKRSRQPQR